MANNENLKKGELTQFRSGEEAARNGKKGGKASGETRRVRRDMKESLNILLSLAVKSGEVIDPNDKSILSEVKGKNLTVSDAILVAQIQKALKGDLKAAEFVRDTVGQKPVDKKDIKQEITNNPFSDLSTDELRKLAADED